MRYPHLAQAAANERDIRVATYPQLVKGGRVPQSEADADVAAWTALAQILDRGTCETEITWSEIHLFTSRAVLNLKDKADAAPPEKRPGFLERFALVSHIHQIAERHKYLIDDTSSLLRERAERQRAAA